MTSTSTITGRPALMDAVVDDIDGAERFYTELLGWEFDAPLSRGGYRYGRLDGMIVAGLRPAATGQPSAWTIYFGSGDITKHAEQVSAAGGQVIHGPADAAGTGTVLVAVDTGDAVFGLWQPTEPWRFHQGHPATLVWSELHTATPDADAFYADLLGYSTQQIGDGEHFDYTVWSADGHTPAGRHRHGSHPHPHWLPYLGVDPAVGTDQVVAAAERLGATVTSAPKDIPAGRVAVLADPAGATFALVDQSRTRRRP